MRFSRSLLSSIVRPGTAFAASLILLGAVDPAAPITASAASSLCTAPSVVTVNVNTSLGCNNALGLTGLPVSGWFTLPGSLPPNGSSMWLALVPAAGTNTTINPNDAIDGSYTLLASSCSRLFPSSSTYAVVGHSSSGLTYFNTFAPPTSCSYTLTFSGATPVPTLAVELFVGTNTSWYYSATVQTLSQLAVLPAMANGAYGGYVTAATIQNIGAAPAIIHISYFDQTGAPVGAGDNISNVPANASWTVRQDNGNSFPSTGGDAAQAGSAIVYSSQPIASFVNEFAPGNVGDATSYSGVQVPSGVGTTLYAPTIVNNAYGGYTTGIGLLNQGSSPTGVTITYRDGSGALVKTQMVGALAAHAYAALYSGDVGLELPDGFAGTATITSSSSQPLGAIVNETGPGGQFSPYDALPAGR